MKNAFMLLMLALTLGACENPYDLVDDSKTYQGLPFVCVSSEQAVIRLGVSPNGNQTELPGVFKDSLVVSHGDMDHAGGLTGLLEKISVNQLFAGEPEKIPQELPIQTVHQEN